MRVLLSVWPYTQSHQIGFSCPQSFPVICLYRQSTVNWHFHCWQGGWDFIDWIFAVQLIISHLLWWECWVVACDQERSATKHFHFCLKKKKAGSAYLEESLCQWRPCLSKAECCLIKWRAILAYHSVSCELKLPERMAGLMSSFINKW